MLVEQIAVSSDINANLWKAERSVSFLTALKSIVYCSGFHSPCILEKIFQAYGSISNLNIDGKYFGFRYFIRLRQAAFSRK